MRVLAVDDEALALALLRNAIEKNLPDAEIYGFTKPSEMFSFIEEHEFDIAFLDINMTGITGIDMAKILKEKMPNLNIIFVTGYDNYGTEAMKLHASGYIVKPVTPEKVRRELEDLRYTLPGKELLTVKCFGNFDVFTPAGEPVNFGRTKSKELLAFLVSKKGTSCTVNELTSILFETAGNDDKKREYTQQIISTLIRKLRELGAEDVINKTYNSMSVNVDKIECDYYKFDENDPQSTKMYKGEFMAQYSWAEYINGYLDIAVQNH